MYIVRRATSGDIKDISALYQESFPEHTRSILGLKTCGAYFEAIHQHDSYYLAVSIKDNKTIAGFMVFHINRLESLGRRWLFADPVSIIGLVVKKPVYLFKRLFFRIKGVMRKKKVSLDKVPTEKGPSVFPLKATGYIDIIAVAKFARKRGVGKLLIGQCVDIAIKKGLKFINLTVGATNKPAIQFYNKLNFRTIIYNPSAESYILSLSLDANQIKG